MAARYSCRMSTRKDEQARNRPLCKGTLDLLILRTLLVSNRSTAKASLAAIQQQSDDTFLVDHSSLYPALQRLEARGWIRAEWGTSTELSQSTLLRIDESWPQAARRRDAPVAPIDIQRSDAFGPEEA